MALFQNFLGWFRGAGAMTEQVGEQRPIPGTQLVDDTRNIGPDGALQIAAVWSCVERRANVVASLPFFVYQRLSNGQKDLARTDRLYTLLHDSPNARMTPFEFWRAMMMNHDLRGNAYARIDRDERTGEALSLWPMPADQVTHYVLDDGRLVYTYRIGNNVAVLASENVLHLKGLGNGTTGLAKLEFMRATTDESSKAQTSASRLFGSHGKPTGVLMVDSVLTNTQREAIRKNFGDMQSGNTGRLYVLEAKMEYKQLAMSPEDQQLLESRQFGIEEICRWMDVPPVLAYHSNVTTWGSGIESILDGWYKLVMAPLLKNIEQAVRKQVMTPTQRARLAAEFSFDALLRGNLKDRLESYAKAVQNGLKTRNECRQLENDPPMAGGDDLTAQTNLVPLSKLGQQPAVGAAATPEPVLQTAIAEWQREQAEAKSQADADRRHSEVISVVRAVSVQSKPQPAPAPPPNVVNVYLPEGLLKASFEQPAGPVINVTNEVNPTPVEVNVTNDVQPTPVEVNAAFEAVVQPAEVKLQLPDRKTTTTFERDRDANITRATQIETDN